MESQPFLCWIGGPPKVPSSLPDLYIIFISISMAGLTHTSMQFLHNQVSFAYSHMSSSILLLESLQATTFRGLLALAFLCRVKAIL